MTGLASARLLRLRLLLTDYLEPVQAGIVAGQIKNKLLRASQEIVNLQLLPLRVLDHNSPPLPPASMLTQSSALNHRLFHDFSDSFCVFAQEPGCRSESGRSRAGSRRRRERFVGHLSFSPPFAPSITPPLALARAL